MMRKKTGIALTDSLLMTPTKSVTAVIGLTRQKQGCALHRCAIAKEYRGSGASQALMRCTDEQARAYGLTCIRVDTHRKNKSMQTLLRESGYRYRGNILVAAEPGHDPRRLAFEKILKDKK